MENRIMYDAVPDAGIDQAMSEAAVEDAFTPAVETSANASAEASPIEGADQSPAPTRSELVFVDASVENYQQLVDEILGESDPGRDVQVIMIDRDADGIEAITRIVGERGDLDAIHLVSHGTGNSVRLGRLWLTASNLDVYASDLETWGRALASDADLLVYGCNLAGSKAGQDLLEAMSHLTGADVAASVDDTGHASLSGDWDLEFKTGVVESEVIIQATTRESWVGLLAANGDLQVEIVSAPNFVVDSNDPKSGPSSAYITAHFTNTGTDTLTDVFAYIGDYVDGISDTPGLYPTRTHTGLAGTFSLTHEGGSAGLSDAIRYIGALAPGETVTQYWLVSYPKTDANGDSVVGGVKPDDDLFVNYDVWATAFDPIDGALLASETETVYMRSEISAAANKIWPNGDNKVPQQYRDAINELLGWEAVAEDGSPSALPGQTLTAQGIWYDLGNVGAGFDNDGDFVPDRNVFLQPVGDPASFDAGQFRLVHSYGLIIVKLKGGGEQLIPFEDQLYHSQIPENTGAVGLVFYEFVALNGAASTSISPYQEVASGQDNEKYSADFGRGIQLESVDPEVEIDKTVDQTAIVQGSATVLSYAIDVVNIGTVAVGSPDFGTPLVVQEAIPAGTTYVGGSAAANNTLPAGAGGYTILYSTDGGTSWVASEPVDPTMVTNIQWWLDSSLAAGESGQVTFQVDVAATYPDLTLVNTAGLSFGSGAAFVEDSTVTLVTGTNAIGDAVFRDDGGSTGILGNGIQDGDESGLGGITLELYLDRNSNGVIDPGDVLWDTTTSAGDGSYAFNNLPSGDFLVRVDRNDANRPLGWSLTTDSTVAVTLSGGDDLDADFGFAPSLLVDKELVGSDPIYEGDLVSYTIDVTNLAGGILQPIGEDIGGFTGFTRYAAGAADTSGYTNPANAIGPSEPDGVFASSTMDGNRAVFQAVDFDVATPIGNITKVEVLVWVHSDGTVNNDFLRILSQNDVAEGLVQAGDIPGPTLAATTNSTLFVFDVTNDPATPWSWSDFVAAATDTMIELETNKQAGPDGADIFVDAVGFRITTDVPFDPSGGGGSFDTDTTLTTVPLVDDYDQTKLRFVSASLAPSSVDEMNGLITWDNVGPINGGATSTIVVTFEALEPAGNSPESGIDNIATVSGAQFANGLDANDHSDSVSVTLNPTAVIGDRIWSDKNGNGADDAEPGIPGITVELLDDTDSVIQTAVTDAAGNYLFKGVRNGNYTVRIDQSTLPAGASLTFDPVGGSDHEAAVTITAATDNPGIDFGYSIANLFFGNIWQDSDGDGGIPEAGEAGISGATVRLFDDLGNLVATTTTDAGGDYRIDGIADGTYRIQVDTSTVFGGSNNQTADPDATFDNQTTSLIVVAGGDVSGSYDFGYQQTGTSQIGDRLFFDWNGDGIQDPEDEGIANVTINLYFDTDGNGVYDAASDPFVASTVTADGSGADPAGDYSFGGLPAGDYIVVVDESDADFPDNVIAPATDPGAVTLLADTTDNGVDFGYQPFGTAAIGDTVWYDKNGDQLQSGAAEAGLQNIDVQLHVDLDGDGTYVLLQTVSTDANGNYLFSNLREGNYRVVVDDSDPELPLDQFGNPYEPTSSTAFDLTLGFAEVNSGIDFGFGALPTIGDRVYFDANNNADLDHNEQGIANVTLVLKDAGTGMVLATTVTSDGSDGQPVGSYRFSGLQPGNYTIEVDTATLPAGTTGADQTADPDRDGVPCDDMSIPGLPACDNAYTTSVNFGDNLTGVDFGYQPDGVVGDYVWFDQDGDGIQDDGEFGLDGVEVTAVLGATTLNILTDPDGRYSFQDLAAGTWTISINTATLMPGATPTSSGDISDLLNGIGSVGADSATVTIDSAGQVTHINGTPVLDGALKLDFGYTLSGSYGIDGTVVLEQSGSTNGVSGDPTDTAIAGLTVYLYNDAGDFLGSTTTDANGYYSFPNLVTDDYIVALATNVPLLENTALTTTASDTPATSLTDNGTTVSQTLTVDAITVISDGGTDPDVVERLDFAFVSTVAYDFGDLPQTYSTTLAGNPIGPRHTVPATPILYLGSNGPDFEPDGQPSIAADGDGADEDGVVPIAIGSWADGASGGAVQVTVSGNGWLVGWIDFGYDGAFGGEGEMVISQAVSTGTHNISVDIPAGTIDGNGGELYARFRLFEEQPAIPQLAFAGTTTGGEVEDYRWTLPPRSVTIEHASVVEGGTLVFEVNLSESSNVAVVLELLAVDGTATGGTDYETGNFEYSIDGITWIPAGGVNGTEITIPAGETTAQVRIETFDDADVESAESFTLSIGSVVSGPAGDISDTATGGIIDDESPNAPPTIDLDADDSTAAGTGAELTFLENGGAISIVDSDFTIADSSDVFIESATIVLTNAQVGDQLVLPAGLPAGIGGSVSSSGGQITVTLTGTGTLADYEAAIAAITFDNAGDTPSSADRSIVVTVNDGEFDSNAATSTIHVIPVNDPPTLSTPGPQTTDEDTALTVGNIGFGDPDAGASSDVMTVTLSVSSGTLTLADTTGLTFVGGTNNGEASLQIQGTLDALNSALNVAASVSYDPNQDFNGNDTLSVTISDEGATGDDPSVHLLPDTGTSSDEQDSAAIAITVLAIDDPATFAGDDGGSVTEDTNVDGFGNLTDSGTLTVTDPDAGEDSVIAATTSGMYGSFTIDSSGNWIYTAANSQITIQQLGSGETLVETFTVQSIDGSTHDVTITLHGMNDVPISGDDVGVTDEDTPVMVAAGSGGVLDNDSDADGDSLSISEINGTSYTPGTPLVLPSGAVLTVNADGSYSYDPKGQFEQLDDGEMAVDSFTYTIDDGNGGTATAAVNITINGVNDIPAGGDRVVSTLEDTDRTLGLADFPFSDPDLEPLAEVRIDTLPTDGTLLLSGNPVSPGDVISAADIGLGQLVFRPDANESGMNYATFDFSVGDGDAFVASPSVMTIHVTAVNQNPDSVDDSNVTDEDTIAIVAAGSGGVLDNDSDPDGDALSVVGVDGAPYTPGTEITLASGALLTINSDGSYSYDPNGQFEYLDDGESVVDSFAYTIDDGNGGSATATVDITINGVNDLPAGGDSVVSTLENTDRTLVLADFPFSDPDLEPLAGVRIDTLPTNGALLLSGNPVNPGDVISAADIALGQLVFRPDPDESGTNYATFDFSVSDGDAFAASPSVMTIHVTAVNENPNAVDDSNSTDEDTMAVVAAGSGGLLDNDSDPDGDAVSVVGVNGAPYTPGTEITLASGALLTINSDGSYSYDPNGQFEYLDDGESVVDGFTYTIDDGNGGTTTASVNITVNGTNDLPAGGDSVISTLENTDRSLGLADFPFSDPDLEPLAEVRIDTLPTDGTLLLSGNPVSPGDVISAIDIDSGQLVFRPDANENGINYATFDFSVGDGDAFVAFPSVMTIHVNPVNQNPDARDDMNTTDEDTVVNVAAGSGGLLDNDTDPDGDPLSIVAVNGVPYTPGTPITLSSGALLTINADGSYSYDPDGQFEYLDDGETVVDSFTYSISDGNGGLDSAIVTILNIAGANDPPASSDSSVSTNEDTDYTFRLSDFPFSDPDVEPLAEVRIDTLPVDGTLLLSGNPVNLGDVISAGDIALGQLVFRPDPDESGANYATFGFSVGDGDAFALSSSVMTIHVNPVNDNPDAVDDSNTASEDSAVNVAAGSGGVLDNDFDADGDALAIVAVNGVPYTPGTQITLDSGALLTINSDGSYSYDPNGQFEYLDDGESAVDSFTYSVSDGRGGRDSAIVSIVNIAGANDPPTGGDSFVSTNEDSAYTFVLSDFPFNDPDAEPLAEVRIDTLPTDGTLLLSGNPVNLGDVISAGDIDLGLLVFLPDANESGMNYATFEFSVGDGDAFALSSSVMTIHVNPVNENPDAVNDSNSTSEDTAINVAAGSGGLLDNDTDPDGDALSIVAVNGVSYAPGTQITLASGALLTINADGSYSYDPNGQFEHLDQGESVVDSFLYTVSDGKGGIVTATVTVTINGSNDPPLAANDFRTTPSNESITVVVTNNDIDPEGDVLNVTLLSVPTAGSTVLNGDGSITYTPQRGFEGTVEIRYRVTDSSGAASEATLTIEVTRPFTWDSFNNFSLGYGWRWEELEATRIPNRLLSREISGLAPEPIFSGSARPGTQIVGRAYDSSGILIGEELAFSDVGGNWMMQFHELAGMDHARFEFIEMAGIGNSFAPRGDIYGYLGDDTRDNDYASLEPWTSYDDGYEFTAVHRQLSSSSLAHLHRILQHPVGLGSFV